MKQLYRYLISLIFHAEILPGLLVISGLVLACSSLSPNSWKTHTDDAMKLTFQYPSSWRVYPKVMEGRYKGIDVILYYFLRSRFNLNRLAMS